MIGFFSYAVFVSTNDSFHLHTQIHRYANVVEYTLH